MVAQSHSAEGGAFECKTVRRTSSRLQKLKESSNVVQHSQEKSVSVVEKKKVIRKKAIASKRRKMVVDTPPSEAADNSSSQVIILEKSSSEQIVLDTAAPAMTSDNLNIEDKSAYAMVTDTLRIFNKNYLHFVQEEEKRCSKAEADKKHKEKKKSAKSEENNTNDDNMKKSSKRPDLKAISKMKETKTILYPERRIGPIPGIDVGHQFFSRAEMVAIGFHSHWLNGIDYISPSAAASCLAGKDSGDKLPLAISIIMSGQYEDDLDNCDDVVYTGQGGNNLLGNKRQIKDQVMERGNLGLKNCMEHSMPVRVTRGHQCANSYVGKVYTYDGLYKVVKYWAEKGMSGFTVYKFRLKRVEGQPPLTTNQVYFTRGRIPNSISEIRGLVCEDITGGQEKIPVPATNLVDDAPIAPTGFAYRKGLKFAQNVKLPPSAPGCNCRGTCSDPRTCACAKLNGSDFPYVHRDGGRLIEPKAVVFECGPNCGCGPDCINRTSQRGLRYRLEVFRTPKKGWGVRSWDFIPSGAPVCEYIGVLMKTDDIDPSSDTNYVFDIDCLQTMKGLDGREKRLGDVCLPTHLQKDDPDDVPEFCIDAGSTGNVTRFINHSCQPNLFVQCVLSSHHDIKQARVILIAADNIPPLKELSYDYGYGVDSVLGPDGKIRQMACYCGAADCRKRLM